MGKFSKAIAGGLGSAISTLVVMGVKHFVKDMTPEQDQALQFVIYTTITSLFVYHAPANEQ